jgi:8-oxo-dGTP pyrophosphatase MutT (NUDIX family)
MRELMEETGIAPDQYRILEEIEPIQEDIKGSNGYNYRNIYYLAEARSLIPVFVDPCNNQQSSEVAKIGWYNYERAKYLIRPYHNIRLKILHRIHKYLASLSPYVNI